MKYIAKLIEALIFKMGRNPYSPAKVYLAFGFLKFAVGTVLGRVILIIVVAAIAQVILALIGWKLITIDTFENILLWILEKATGERIPTLCEAIPEQSCELLGYLNLRKIVSIAIDFLSLLLIISIIVKTIAIALRAIFTSSSH